MPAPINTFKKRLRKGDQMFGCWVGLGEMTPTEIVGTAGFDWLVIDNEHSPNDMRSTRDQLMALQGSSSHPIVRVPKGEAWIIKQMLDIGAQTILVPMVNSADEAREMVQAMRYPPHGIRGMGSAIGRVSRYNEIKDYVSNANDEVCLIVQVETQAALDALPEILKVEGVDGVFIGPADLAADMGHHGDASVPEVAQAIDKALRMIAASDKAAGMLSMDPKVAQASFDAGAQFVAVATDVLLLADAARKTVKHWK